MVFAVDFNSATADSNSLKQLSTTVLSAFASTIFTNPPILLNFDNITAAYSTLMTLHQPDQYNKDKKMCDDINKYCKTLIFGCP